MYIDLDMQYVIVVCNNLEKRIKYIVLCTFFLYLHAKHIQFYTGAMMCYICSNVWAQIVCNMHASFCTFTSEISGSLLLGWKHIIFSQYWLEYRNTYKCNKSHRFLELINRCISNDTAKALVSPFLFYSCRKCAVCVAKTRLYIRSRYNHIVSWKHFIGKT